MRRTLLSAASIAVLGFSAALGQEDVTIDDERSTPVDTANAAGAGQAANIVIGSNGRVILAGQPGPAVRMNSDNDVTTEAGSRIEIDDVDGAIGIQADPGVTGDIRHAGTIQLGDSFSGQPGEGADPDDPAPPFAEDRNKTGVLIGEVDGNFNPVANQAGFTGDIEFTTSSNITVAGQDSYGLRTVTAVDGDIIANGQITMRGENSRGVSIESDVSGDVQISRVNVNAPGGHAAVIDGDVGGGLRLTGAINVSGFRVGGRLLADAFRELREGSDLDSGSAVIIAGNIANGAFISQNANIALSSGGGATVDIGRSNDTITLGEAVIPGQPDPDEEDEDAGDPDPEALGYALVNRGTVRSASIFDGKDSIAFLIAGIGDDGLLRTVILEAGGMQNTGTITASAFDADATAVLFGQGASADSLHNTGTIQATASLGFDDDGFADDRHGAGRAFGVVLEEGSSLRELLNQNGQIIATVLGGGASATAIRVENGSLEQLTNMGLISARASELTGEFDAANISLVAIDASEHHGGLHVLQTALLDEDGNTVSTPIIQGDIIFGDGDNTLELRAGRVFGDVFFGEGSDRLIINGAELNGAISSKSGDLTIEVTDGRLEMSGADSLNVREALFNSGGVLDITIDRSGRDNAFMIATDSIRFEEGSDLSVSLANLIGQSAEIPILTAGALSFADEAGTLDATDAPFLYNASLRRDENDANTLVLTLERKTADELGFDANRAAAFNEALAVFESVEALGAAMASLRSQDVFFSAYDQLLPEFAASAIQFALASNDAVAGSLSTRLQNARMAPDRLAGVWVQEFGYFADRSTSAFGPGYRGQGIGLAVGVDRPLGPFYAVGVSFAGAASEIEQIGGFNEPMTAFTGQFGVYAGMDVGGFDVSGYAAIGIDRFETERNIRIANFTASAIADWGGWHASASAVAGRDINAGKWLIRPEAALTYLTLMESGFTETSTGVNAEVNNPLALIVDDRTSSVLTGAATVTLARRFGTDYSWWLPSLRAGYRGDFIGAESTTTARFGPDGNPFNLRSADIAGSGFLVGLGLSAGSNYSTFSFAYDADIRDGFIRHVGRIMIRLTF